MSLAPPAPLEIVLRTEGLSRRFPAVGRSAELELFRDLDLTVCAGEMVAIVGASGAGKSSLLHLLAALDRPSSGKVWVGGELMTGLSTTALTRLRGRKIGYLWQSHYLLPEFTAEENVAMPLLAQGFSMVAARPQVLRWLERVGLRARADHRAGELSGGEQQRVSLARALVTQPILLLADEPTGDLDEGTAEDIFLLLQQLQRDNGLAAILVTHHMGLAQRCDRRLRLHSGRLTDQP